MHKYNDDAKIARVHKRIREENARRKTVGKTHIVSDFDESVMEVLLSIKADADQKVYDRNDILKKDAYFEHTVMTQVKLGMDRLSRKSAHDDRVFTQTRIANTTTTRTLLSYWRSWSCPLTSGSLKSWTNSLT